jgi:O-antigen/teichoic acid export membrane protein
MLARLKAHASGPQLRARAIQSTLVTLLQIGLNHPLRLATNLVLTRILMPDVFGLMALITVIHGALFMASDMGLKQSVIRSDNGSDPQFLRVVWTVQILRNLGLVAVILALAGLLRMAGAHMAGSTSVYGDPRLPEVLAASGIVVLLRGLQAPSVLLAERKLRMIGIVKYRLISQAVGTVLTVFLSWWLQTVWGLVIAAVLQGILWTAMTHTVIPGPRMRLAWNRAQTREMWIFGRWVIPSSLGEFLATNGDRLALAAILPAPQFGLYAVAYVWVQAGIEVLNQIAATVFLPAFSEIRRRNAAGLTRALRRGFAVYVVLAMACFAASVALGLFVIENLYTGAFASIGPVVAALAFKIPFLSFWPLTQMIMGEGDSRHVGLSQLLRGTGVVGAILVGFPLFGVPGAMLLQIVAVTPALLMLAMHESWPK